MRKVIGRLLIVPIPPTTHLSTIVKFRGNETTDARTCRNLFTRLNGFEMSTSERVKSVFLSTFSTSLVACDTGYAHEGSSLGVADVLDADNSLDSEMLVTSEPQNETLKEIGTLASWTLIVSAWLAAVIGPIYAMVALLSGNVDRLLNFLCVWLLGALVSLPPVSLFRDAVTRGVTSWFERFTITYENNFRGAISSEAKQRTIYCYHPHGLISIGAGLLAVDLIRKGEPVAIVASAHMRWFNPVMKLLLDLAGIEIIGASASDVQDVMKKGDKSLILVVGGYEEAVITKQGFERLFLKNRLGFVKYALRYGYSLTPVYAYGENDLYNCAQFGESLRSWFAKWKIPLVFFYGDPRCPLLPVRSGSDLRIVVGSPLFLSHVENPSNPFLRSVHSNYVNLLTELYYRNNSNIDRPLEIF